VKLYLATSNPGKVREFMNAGLDVEMMPGMKDVPVAPETGETFEANAVEKALYYAARCDGLLMAEDSGLEVDALGGAPGIHSARWAGGDAENNAKLMREMAGQAVRTARYVCVIALVQGPEVLGTFRGTVEGEIADGPRGEGGFGYDPYFLYPPLGKTFAEISKEAKGEFSHRGNAIAKLTAWSRDNASRLGNQ
jgi:XTP/dITP diphosphohydrolase